MQAIRLQRKYPQVRIYALLLSSAIVSGVLKLENGFTDIAGGNDATHQ